MIDKQEAGAIRARIGLIVVKDIELPQLKMATYRA